MQNFGFLKGIACVGMVLGLGLGPGGHLAIASTHSAAPVESAESITPTEPVSSAVKSVVTSSATSTVASSATSTVASSATSTATSSATLAVTSTSATSVAPAVSTEPAKTSESKTAESSDLPSFAYGPSPSIAMHGDLKYSENFTHFDYVFPDAPKGGTLRLSAMGTFDNYHPFILKGNAAAGTGMIFDTLMVHSNDEPFSLYGLLAQTIEIAPDRTWVEFRLHPEARFHDRTPVTADDVVFTFTQLKQKGHPHYRVYYRDVTEAVALDTQRVRFHLSEPDNPELPLIVAELPVFSKNWWSGRDFSEPVTDFPMGSGPYRLDASQPGRSVSYVRDPNYWGRELPVNKGRYNFDRIVYEYYRDELVQFEGFKAGEYDFRTEHVAKNWATGYDFPAVQSGLVTLQEIPHGNSSGMQGFVFNTRKSIFSDVRVREALGYAFDFEWSNRTLFHNAYTRSTSYFSNTELAASGVPTPAERRLLDPFRQILPDQLFTQPFALPETDGSGNIRHNLIQASRLLKQAGWEIKQNRLIRTADNTPMEFEILLVQPMFERIVLPFTQNLEILGIKATVRVVDAAQYLKRIEHFDFDMIVSSFGQSLSPGNEQRSYWGSENAPIQGSGNLAGIEDPVVDAMIDEIIAAPDREALVSAARALDRVLLWGHYVIPHYHINTWRMAYWSKFKQPQTAPLYDLGLMNWWVDPEAEKALNQQLSRSTSREQRSE